MNKKKEKQQFFARGSVVIGLIVIIIIIGIFSEYEEFDGNIHVLDGQILHCNFDFNFQNYCKFKSVPYTDARYDEVQMPSGKKDVEGFWYIESGDGKVKNKWRDKTSTELAIDKCNNNPDSEDCFCEEEVNITESKRNESIYEESYVIREKVRGIYNCIDNFRVPNTHPLVIELCGNASYYHDLRSKLISEWLDSEVELSTTTTCTKARPKTEAERDDVCYDKVTGTSWICSKGKPEPLILPNRSCLCLGLHPCTFNKQQMDDILNCKMDCDNVCGEK